MVKITIENDGMKTELAGRSIFVVVIDPESGGDMVTALMGNTSPYKMVDSVGKCIGKQIKTLVPSHLDKITLIEILGKSVARGLYGDDIKEIRIR
jgi:hypothetical protein